MFVSPNNCTIIFFGVIQYLVLMETKHIQYLGKLLPHHLQRDSLQISENSQGGGRGETLKDNVSGIIKPLHIQCGYLNWAQTKQSNVLCKTPCNPMQLCPN